jgi:hypothetical protein
MHAHAHARARARAHAHTHIQKDIKTIIIISYVSCVETTLNVKEGLILNRNTKYKMKPTIINSINCFPDYPEISRVADFCKKILTPVNAGYFFFHPITTDLSLFGS